MNRQTPSWHWSLRRVLLCDKRFCLICTERQGKAQKKGKADPNVRFNVSRDTTIVMQEKYPPCSLYFSAWCTPFSILFHREWPIEFLIFLHRPCALCPPWHLFYLFCHSAVVRWYTQGCKGTQGALSHHSLLFPLLVSTASVRRNLIRCRSAECSLTCMRPSE